METLLQHYLNGRISLAQACAELGIHRTTLWRRCRRLKKQGEAGLLHKLIGRRSNRAKPEEMRGQILKLWREVSGATPISVYDFHRKMARKMDLDLSYRTLLRWLKESSCPFTRERS